MTGRTGLMLAALILLPASGWNMSGTGSSPWFSLQGPGTPAAGNTVYYDPTIRDIVRTDCARCHSGRRRNLMGYQRLKAYADNGLLAVMVGPGGPMHRFSGPDTAAILAWIDAGAPGSSAPAVQP